MALVKTLKGTAQNFTTSWVDYGDEIGTDGHALIALWDGLSKGTLDIINKCKIRKLHVHVVLVEVE